MSLENFAEELRCITKSLYHVVNSFTESLNELTTTASSIAINDDTDFLDPKLRKLYNELEPSLEKTILNVRLNLQKHLEKFQAKQQDVRKLRGLHQKAKLKNETQEKHIEKFKRECEIYEKETAELQNERDCIRTCKILTCTEFAFKKKYTMGYIKLKSQDYEVFNYDKSKVNAHDRKNEIWRLVENLVSKDSKSRND